ncbi:MAG: WbqC family protein [Eubacterium sp.]|jgi:hypothetical protein|nr:WbqC family protein [Eubacterium sp.]
MNKTVAVIQSNYLPWKGYFDIIHDADEFIIYDDVSYTTHDWRNRNILYYDGKKKWITLPCGYDRSRLICEVTMNDKINWPLEHWNSIEHAYKNAPFFSRYSDFFKNTFFEIRWKYLSELNSYLIKKIAVNFLGISTVISDSRDYMSAGTKQDKIISLLKSAGATRYVSGPAAKAYIDEAQFEEAGIKVIWKDYSGYPEYKQLCEPFEHGVSILDLLFNTGADAPYYIWGWRN